MQILALTFILGYCIIPAFTLPSLAYQHAAPVALSSSSMPPASASHSSDHLVDRKLNARAPPEVPQHLNTLYENLDYMRDTLDQVNDQARYQRLQIGILSPMKALLFSLIQLIGGADEHKHMQWLNANFPHYSLSGHLDLWESLLESLFSINFEVDPGLLQECNELSNSIKDRFDENLALLQKEDDIAFQRDHPGKRRRPT